MTDIALPFADGDDPDDAWTATDPVLTLLAVIRRRVIFAIVQRAADRDARLLSIADDLERIRERIADGDL